MSSPTIQLSVLAAYIIFAPSGALPDLWHTSIPVSSVSQDDFENPISILVITHAQMSMYAGRHTLPPYPDFSHRHFSVKLDGGRGNGREINLRKVVGSHYSHTSSGCFNVAVVYGTSRCFGEIVDSDGRAG
jgi:hypothetical protein